MQKQLEAELVGTYADIVEAEVSANEKYDIAANTEKNLQLAEQRLAEKYAAKTTTEASSLRGGAKRHRQLLQGWTDTVRANGGRITAEALGQEIQTMAKTIYKTDDPNLDQLNGDLCLMQANAQREDGTKVFADRQAVKKALRPSLKARSQRGRNERPAKQVWPAAEQKACAGCSDAGSLRTLA